MWILEPFAMVVDEMANVNITPMVPSNFRTPQLSV